MNLVFSTHELPPAQRYQAWREALCALYVRVDSRCDAQDAYQGYVKEARFGEVTVTDCYLSPQEITRRRAHMNHLDKDCLYLAIMQKGRQTIEQCGHVLACDAASAGLFSASQPYGLQNAEAYRAYYLELPRSALAERLAPGRLDQPQVIPTASGMGRIMSTLCASMVLEDSTLPASQRAPLGERLLDLLALAVDCEPDESPLAESPVRDERLRQIHAYIDAHLGNSLLNPERIAAANQLSVRTLHYLFKESGKSVSDHLWERRLQRCRDELESPLLDHRSVTEIALANGFNSMSHFSSVFRRRYGMSPTEARSAAIA